MTKTNRKTTRDWMKTSRYEYECNDLTVNIMLAANIMCKSTGWNNPHRMKTLWDRTSKNGRGVENTNSIITIQRSKRNEFSRGHCESLVGYGFNHGYKRVHVSGAKTNLGHTLVILLHELCHADQGNLPTIDGKTRPHDLPFNIQQYKMARKWWGYTTHPEDAGWSIGKGYAPTKHLRVWLEQKIVDQDPKVMAWLKKIVF